jgi:ADP-ribosylglycohydrolase
VTTTERDRARGALVGLALGDALGMPAEGLSFAAVQERFGLIERFAPSPADNPISAGRPAGTVTDDTDQAVIVGRLLVAGEGRLHPLDLARELLAWAERMSAAGSRDLLGPSTERALARLAEGVAPEESGRDGTTNGAAMRIAPVGLCCPVRTDEELRDLVDRVALVSRVTHNTGVAIAGAAAVATAVSAGVGGLGAERATALAVNAARIGASYGATYGSDTDVAAAIDRAVDLVAGHRPPDALELVDRLVGTSVATAESVPAALALASLLDRADPWLVVRCAASLGGDSDTIAAMAGAVCGAIAGVDAFPLDLREQLAGANPGLDLATLADALVVLRPGR